MSVRLIVRSRAETDLAKASQWYEQRATGLGAHFLDCVDRAVNLIEHNPLAFPVYHREFRRALVPRFPFGVFYIATKEDVIVFAVLHLAQDPQTIRHLLSE